MKLNRKGDVEKQQNHLHQLQKLVMGGPHNENKYIEVIPTKVDKFFAMHSLSSQAYAFFNCQERVMRQGELPRWFT